MENKHVALSAPLQLLPPVDFCCAYGSALLPCNQNKATTMVDYILGVSDPVQWHSENLEKNRDHYASWMAYLGPKMITKVADGIGVGVHFNPFVALNEEMIKYGVVRMHDLVQDLLNWESFYLSGRLQKPVYVLADNLDIGNINSVNLKAATSAAILLLPPEFTEGDLYAKICALSYMGDLRMLFAEDRNKVKKIVQGSFGSFQAMYKPFLDEFAAKGLLKISLSGGHQAAIKQDCSLSASRSLVSTLPQRIRSQMGMKLQGNDKPGQMVHNVAITSREEAAKCIQKVVRRLVMVSSARQAVSGVLAAGGMNACRYLVNKMSKAYNLDIGNINSVNLKAATSAALLLLPPEFTEGDLYAKICALSYMGDLRMLFAEDRNKVKKIVQGSFGSFQAMYKPFLDEFAAKGLLKISLSGGHQAAIKQDCSLSASRSLVSTLPRRIRSQMGTKLQGNDKPGQMVHNIAITSREEAAKCIQKVVRRLVMVSSARQAVSGVLAAGGVNACRYLVNKMSKAWKSHI